MCTSKRELALACMRRKLLTAAVYRLHAFWKSVSSLRAGGASATSMSRECLADCNGIPSYRNHHWISQRLRLIVNGRSELTSLLADLLVWIRMARMPWKSGWPGLTVTERILGSSPLTTGSERAMRTLEADALLA